MNKICKCHNECRIITQSFSLITVSECESEAHHRRRSADGPGSPLTSCTSCSSRNLIRLCLVLWTVLLDRSCSTAQTQTVKHSHYKCNPFLYVCAVARLPVRKTKGKCQYFWYVGLLLLLNWWYSLNLTLCTFFHDHI